MDSVIRKFPIGIQNFESLINDGYVYVDKTALVYRMATTGRVFLSIGAPPVGDFVVLY